MFSLGPDYGFYAVLYLEVMFWEHFQIDETLKYFKYIKIIYAC